MSTKPDSDTGWTASPAQGFYWWRLDANDPPDPVLVENGLAEGKSISVYGGEFLGPISPDDFEQLIQLRNAAQDAERFLAWWCEATVPNPPKGVRGAKKTLAALREALAHKGEQS